MGGCKNSGEVIVGPMCPEWRGEEPVEGPRGGNRERGKNPNGALFGGLFNIPGVKVFYNPGG